MPGVLGRELLDCIAVRRRAPGIQLEQVSLIEGISMEITPESWVVTWTLSAADVNAYMVLDTGRLDTALLSY